MRSSPTSVRRWAFRPVSVSRSSRSSATWRSKPVSTASSARRAAVIVELFGGPALPWWAFAAVAFVVTTFVGYRNIELSSRVLAVLLTAEIAIVVVLDAVIVLQGGDHGLSNGIVNPSAIFSGSLGIGLLFATDQLRRLRGHRDLPRRSQDSGSHHSARHLHRPHPDRRVLRGDQLGADLRLGRRGSGKPRQPIPAPPSWPTPRSATSASSAPTSSRCSTSPACSPASCRSTTWRRGTSSPCLSATCYPSR